MIQNTEICKSNQNSKPVKTQTHRAEMMSVLKVLSHHQRVHWQQKFPHQIGRSCQEIKGGTSQIHHQRISTKCVSSLCLGESKFDLCV